MRLKKLTLCLFGLGLSACSTYSINTHSTTANSLDLKAANAVNAMYAYPSYEFNGHFNVVVKADPSVKEKPTARQLDAKLEAQIEQYLGRQKLKLSKQQKQDLYQAIALENGPSYRGSSAQVTEMISNFVSDLQFSYDGSVHYREKLAAFNITTKYQKKNLLVEAKFPMVLDLKNHKFYFNYFGLMPLLVNANSQNDFAYIDFSKYKNAIDLVDFKNLTAYLKESTAISYVLTDPKQLQQVSVSSAEKAKGVVEKVRLKMSLEEFILQQAVFEQVNKPYVKKSIIDFDKLIANESDKPLSAADEKQDRDYSGYGMSREEVEAHRVSEKLYSFVNAQLYPDAVEAEAAEEVYAPADQDDAEATEVADYATASAEDTVDARAASQEDSTALSEEQCDSLAATPANAKMGDVTYCEREYDVGILNTKKERSGSKTPFDFTEIEGLFKQYQSTELVDAQALKLLWIKHSNGINAALAQHQSNPIVIDVGLDAQGRAIRYDYDVAYTVEKFGQIQFKMDMNVFNYGKAKSIAQTELNNAKSIEEASQGSPFESMIKGLSRTLGIPEKEGSDDHERVKVKSLNKQLKQLAVQVYDQTQSYSQSYQAVFIMKLSSEQPEIVKHYSAQKLNEIAQVYAYSFADESIYNPQGKALIELEKLIEQHHLQNNANYDDELGNAVYDEVLEAIEQAQQRQVWNKVVQQYKQPQAVFAQYYMLKFLEEQALDQQKKNQLKVVADILAQTYLDARKDKLSAKSVAGLKSEADEYIDYNLYRETYEKMMKQFK